MTGFPFEPGDALGPEAFALVLARRTEAFRTRIVQLAILGVLVLRPDSTGGGGPGHGVRP